VILDLHVHSEASDDSRAPVAAYLTWLGNRREARPLDGIVLTEHRHFDLGRDYRDLEDRFGLRILRGAEIETSYGHMLVYGVDAAIVQRFDFGDVRLPAQTVITEVARMGGLVIPCHPGRPTVGLYAHYELAPPLEGVVAVETLNGGSRRGEDERAAALVGRYGYRGVGGSDAHMVSFVGACATEFAEAIEDERDLVQALLAGRYRAVDYRRRPASLEAGGTLVREKRGGDPWP
jgi:predicted metal-dependent phosphoesterase TrpH